tara:strand:+ start:4656 stop:5933 length:1278 start_codon:yes stop_codon:yes gene_type:complete
MKLGIKTGVLVFCALVVVPASAEDAADLKRKIALDEAFPDPDGATYFAGEITLVEHVNRRGILRLDRDGSMNKYYWDLPHHFQMLPYGSIFLQGAPAELKDIPLGTHLHGEFYYGPEGAVVVTPPKTDYEASKLPRPDLRSVETAYSRVFRFEDDFSFYQRQGSGWKITGIAEALNEITLERVSLANGEPVKPGKDVQGPTGTQVLRMDRGTQVWKGREFAALEDLAVGQIVQRNTGWMTLLGSYEQDGLCREIWIDDESRKVAATRQLGRHISHQQRRGIPAKILKTESVPGEGARGYAVVQIHAGVAEELMDAFQEKVGLDVSAVEPSLRTWGPFSKPASIVAVNEVANPEPGSSGVELRLHFYEMVEGFRVGRTVRMALRDWKAPEVPREERLDPNDVRIFSVGPPYITGRDAAPTAAESNP